MTKVKQAKPLIGFTLLEVCEERRKDINSLLNYYIFPIYWTKAVSNKKAISNFRYSYRSYYKNRLGERSSGTSTYEVTRFVAAEDKEFYAYWHKYTTEPMKDHFIRFDFEENKKIIGYSPNRLY